MLVDLFWTCRGHIGAISGGSRKTTHSCLLVVLAETSRKGVGWRSGLLMDSVKWETGCGFSTTA